MKLKLAAAVLLFGALTVAPLHAAEEPDDGSVEVSGRVEPSPAAEEQAAEAPAQEAVEDAPATSKPQPAAAADVPRQEAKKESPPAAPVSTGVEEKAPKGGSWWGNVMYTLGLGNDPNPGEIVQTVAKRPDLSPDYVIGPGDQVGISVWRDDNLTRTVVVLPDGKISFPLVGEVVAGGKTVAQLKQELEGKLARFIADTGVTVEVKQSNSMLIYIIGRVNVPGRQMLLANTNVLQALAMAGGPNAFAASGKIKVFREEAGKTIYFPFNYYDVSEGKHLETNIELKRGDVIIVP